MLEVTSINCGWKPISALLLADWLMCPFSSCSSNPSPQTLLGQALSIASKIPRIRPRTHNVSCMTRKRFSNLSQYFFSTTFKAGSRIPELVISVRSSENAHADGLPAVLFGYRIWPESIHCGKKCPVLPLTLSSKQRASGSAHHAKEYWRIPRMGEGCLLHSITSANVAKRRCLSDRQPLSVRA